MRLPLAELFKFVIAISKRYNIDESHSLGHSMRVLHNAEIIAREEAQWMCNTELFVVQQPIIQAAAILHDTCDKKYREEGEAVKEVSRLLSSSMNPVELDATLQIISKMSYSTVKAKGMPDLREFQFAYNAVREADLLDAYDFDRSMLYHMHKNDKGLEAAYKDACDLFENRVLRHDKDGLLLTRYARSQHLDLSEKALRRIRHWARILK